MAEAVDPNLVKLGMGNFSWINEGVKDAGDYAMKVAQVETQREAIKMRAREHELQKSVVRGNTGMSLLNSIQAISESEPGSNERKAKVQGFLAKAKVLGVQLAPGFDGTLLDMTKDDTMAQLVQAVMNEPDPAKRFELAMGAQGIVGDERYKSLIDKTFQDLKTVKEIEGRKAVATINAEAKVDAAETKNQNAVAKETDKKISDLRNRVAGINSKMGSVLQAPEAIEELLKKKTSASDIAVAQQFQKLIGDSRVAAEELKQMKSLGALSDRFESIISRNLGSGETFSDDVRTQIFDAVQSVKRIRNSAYKQLVSPYYREAQTPAMKAAFDQGRIFDDPAGTRAIFESKDVADNIRKPGGGGGTQLSAQAISNIKILAKSKSAAEVEAILNQNGMAGFKFSEAQKKEYGFKR